MEHKTISEDRLIANFMDDLLKLLADHTNKIAQYQNCVDTLVYRSYIRALIDYTNSKAYHDDINKTIINYVLKISNQNEGS